MIEEVGELYCPFPSLHSSFHSLPFPVTSLTLSYPSPLEVGPQTQPAVL